MTPLRGDATVTGLSEEVQIMQINVDRGLDLEKLFVDVFDPQTSEKVLVMVDIPRGEISDSSAWILKT